VARDDDVSAHYYKITIPDDDIHLGQVIEVFVGLSFDDDDIGKLPGLEVPSLSSISRISEFVLVAAANASGIE